MCELFAMSSRLPTNVRISMQAFARHGGETDHHRDGWGVAIYDGSDARLIKEDKPASQSHCLDYIRKHQCETNLLISHIRKQTQGEISFSNTQPFSRELSGQLHVFAHNGDLNNIKAHLHQSTPDQPLGSTDSEWAFCHLLHGMRQLWAKAKPGIQARFNLVRKFADLISPLGPANFLYSDGEYLFAHGHERSQKGKTGTFPPGLFYLERKCHENIDGLELTHPCTESSEQQVVLIASVPLSTENWLPFEAGEILMIRQGQLIQV